MKLTFLGTRGGIIARSKLHYMHSSLLITYQKSSILIDWGEDWLDQEPPAGIASLFITHAHPDHVGGLKHGFPAPVYASKDTFKKIKRYPLRERIVVQPGYPIKIGSMTIEPFAVYHSIHAPALGYRVTAGKRSIFYVPDLISIIDEKQALKNLDLYIGDGAIITRRMLVRKKNGIPVGHTPIKEQLEWCQKNQVPRMIITHCGSEIVKGQPDVLSRKLSALSHSAGNAKLILAYDMMQFKL